MQDGSYQKGQGIYTNSYTYEDASSLFSIMVSINRKIYVYEHGQESTLSFTSLDSIRFLIENVFSKDPLLTRYQANRYATLEAGLLKSKNWIKISRRI